MDFNCVIGKLGIIIPIFKVGIQMYKASTRSLPQPLLSTPLTLLKAKFHVLGKTRFFKEVNSFP